MHKALHELGFTFDRGVDQRGQLYSMISIVLQLGNVQFQEAIGEEAASGGCAIVDQAQFDLTAELLQVGKEVLLAALTTSITMFGKDEVLQQLSPLKIMALQWCTPSRVHTA